jgi:hypothetical protein
MDSRPPADIADALIEAQDDCIFEDAAEVIEASTAEVIEAPTAEVIEAPAEGSTAPATATTPAESTAVPIVPITITEPEPPAHITLVYEVIPEVSTCIIFNGKTFNRPCQANLSSNNGRLSPVAFVIPIFEQEYFHGQLSMSWTGTRTIDPPNTKPSEKVNPCSIYSHTLKIDISSLDIEAFTIVYTAKYGPLPEAFGCQTTNPKADDYFNIIDKAYIIFHIKKLNATGTDIPYIDICSCSKYLKSLSKEILSTKQ